MIALRAALRPRHSRGPYTRYLTHGALKGKRFAVPAFILDGDGPVFQGICPNTPAAVVARIKAENRVPLKPETRAAFLRAVGELRGAGATVIIDPAVLPDSFAEAASRVCSLPYLREGYDRFLGSFGPSAYRSVDGYASALRHPLPNVVIGGDTAGISAQRDIKQVRIEDDPTGKGPFMGPRKALMAAYEGELDRLHLDGFVYPAIQMPPVDETMPQDKQISGGPHSDTDWANMLGVPAISVPAGFYADGLPFGIEFSARPWRDGDLISWAFDYERVGHHRRRPVLVEGGLLAGATRPLEPASGP